MGADKSYDHRPFLTGLEKRKITPHVATKGGAIGGHTRHAGYLKKNRSSIEARRRMRRRARGVGYELSQRCRKKIEEAFGWVLAASMYEGDMTCKPVHLMILLLAMLGLASSLCAADKLTPEGTAPSPPSDPRGPCEIIWFTPEANSGHFTPATLFSRDGKRLIVALHGETQVWDTATWKPVGKPIKYDYLTRKVSFDSSGKLMLALTQHHVEIDRNTSVIADAQWQVWDLGTGEPLGPIVRVKDAKGKVILVPGAVISPDGQLVAVQAGPNHVELRRADTGELDRSYEHKAGIRSRRFTPDNTLTIIGSDRVANVWDTNTGKLRATHEDFSNLVHCAGGRVLEEVFAWGFSVREIETGKLLLKRDDYLKYSIGDLCISPSGNRAAVVVRRRIGPDQTEVWDVETGKLLTTIKGNGPTAMDGRGTVLLVNHWTAKQGDAHKSDMWDVEKGEKIRDFDGYIGNVAFSPDGNLLVMKQGRLMRVLRADPTKKGAERWKVDKVEEKK